MLIGGKADGARGNGKKVGGHMTTQKFASFPEIMKSVKNLKGPVSIIDSDAEGEMMASEWQPNAINEEDDDDSSAPGNHAPGNHQQEGSGQNDDD